MSRRPFEVIRPCPECGDDFVHITFSGHIHKLCITCRKPICSECETRVPVERGFKRTCSDECQKIVNTRNNRTRLENNLEKNPNYYKEVNARYVERVNSDIVRRALYLGKESERYQKRKNDPKYKAVIAKAKTKYRASEHGKATENRYRVIYRENLGESEYLKRRREVDKRRREKNSQEAEMPTLQANK